MKRAIAILGAFLVSLVMCFGLTSPAQASESPPKPQKFCNSSKSYYGFEGWVDVNQDTHLKQGQCVTSFAGSTITLIGGSFRVAYNGGDYQGCQNFKEVKEFVPSSKPYQIYFRVYRKSGCKN